MRIDRAALLNAIETVKPALATKELIEELLFCWSDGETLTAFNDASLGIQIPLKSEFKGGVRGTILLGILHNSRAKEVEIDFPEEGMALFKVGRTKLKMPLLAPERAVHALPAIAKGGKGFRASASFLAALKASFLSLGSSSAMPEQMGVSIVYRAGLQFYTTDDKTICWTTSKEDKGWPLKPDERIIIPSAFAEQLIKLGDEKTELFVTKDEVLAQTGSGIKLFARLLDSPKPTDFRGMIDEAMKGVQLITIPSRLKLALERAIIVLGPQADSGILMSVDEDVLRIRARTDNAGDLNDSIRLEEFPKPVKLRVNPILIKEGLIACSKIGLSEYTTVMIGENLVYCISNLG